MRIAFDIDDTLFKLVVDTMPRPIAGVGATCICGIPLKQERDEVLFELAHQLVLEPDNEVFLWSAGGEEYVHNFIRRFAPAWASLVKVIPKEKGHNIDICFDDQPVDLATVNLRIAREHADHHE